MGENGAVLSSTRQICSRKNTAGCLLGEHPFLRGVPILLRKRRPGVVWLCTYIYIYRFLVSISIYIYMYIYICLDIHLRVYVYIYTYTYTVCTCVYIIIKLCSAVEYINMYFIYVYTKNTHAYVNVNYSMHILSANTYTCTEYGCSTGNLHILQLYTHVYSYMYVGYVMLWYGMVCHVMSCHVYIYIHIFIYTSTYAFLCDCAPFSSIHENTSMHPSCWYRLPFQPV
jgi:hypothetical protein